MVRLPCKDQLGPGDALHAFHGADREAFGLQRRALLDMQLDIGVDVRPPHRRFASITYAPQRLPSDGAVDADGRQRRFQRQRAGEDQAAEHVGLEARAFLVGEEGDRKRPPGDEAGVVERLHDLEPRENAERPVVPAAGLDGVDVAPHHDRRAVLQPAPNADDIADGVDGNGEPQFAHPADDEVAAPPIGLAEGETVDPAVRPRAHLGQPFEARGESRAIHSKIVSHGVVSRVRVPADPTTSLRAQRINLGGRPDLAATMKHLCRDCVQTQLMVLLSQAV